MRHAEGFMHGVNLGGWLSQIDAPTAGHFENFISRKDIAYIARMGLDHVRVPVDYTILETESGEIKPEGFACLDRCAQWCGEYGLHMIIDLHKTFGYSFDPLDTDDKTAFFSDPAYQQRFYRLWKTIAARYAGASDRIAFELLNEIVEPEVAESWNRIALQAIHEIRTLAPDNWIIFGGVMYNSVVSIPQLPDISDRKIMYTFHCYEPIVFTHQGAYWVHNMPSNLRLDYPAPYAVYAKSSRGLDHALVGALCNGSDQLISPLFFEDLFTDALKISAKRDIPLYCGEYGVIDLADNGAKLRWIQDICTVFDKHGIGRAYWNYRAKDFGIVDIADEKVRETICRSL